VSLQEVFCRACGQVFEVNFSNSDKWGGEVCSETCYDELLYRKQLSKENKPYFPRCVKRWLRIAELDYSSKISPLIKKLRIHEDLDIDRYKIESPAYDYFKAAPPEAALDFPIATLEEIRPGNQVKRVYGLDAVIDFLTELQVEPCYAVTRKMVK
jgi:hypothetical protein